MCVEALLKSAIRHMQVLVHRFKAQGRQARDRRAAAALSDYLYVLESSVWVCEEAACFRGQPFTPHQPLRKRYHTLFSSQTSSQTLPRRIA